MELRASNLSKEATTKKWSGIIFFFFGDYVVTKGYACARVVNIVNITLRVYIPT